MQKVTVYYFTCYDIKTDQTLSSRRPATLETIAACKGEVLKDTAQEVDISSLDGNGFFIVNKGK